jgi:hypothetical protein
MSYGIELTNENGELTMSSDGFLYGYIGKATAQVVSQPGTNTVGSNAGSVAYTIDWAGDIIVALGVPGISTWGVSLSSMTRSGNTWTIVVLSSMSSATNSIGFPVQAAGDVYVWGRPTVASGYGVAIYDANENLVGDLSRRPLLFNDIVQPTTAAVDEFSIGSYVKPAVVGSPYMTQSTSQSGGGGATPWTNRRFTGRWTWDSVNAKLIRNYVMSFYARDDGGIPVATSRRASTAIVIEANGLT